MVPSLIAAANKPQEEAEPDGSKEAKEPQKPHGSTGEVAIKQWEAAVRSLVDSQPFEFKHTDSLFKKVTEFASPYVKGAKSGAAALEASKKAFKNLFIQDDYQAKVSQFFGEKLHPRLLYFPDYKVIDGIIDIAAYVGSSEQTPKRSDTGYQFEKAETVRNLFHLAQLEPKELEALAKSPPRLTSFLNRCSDRLTEMLALTWKSKKIDVRLHYTNGTVTIEVGDIYLDGTTKNRGLLDRRSAGFKWHFSFFVNFRAGIQQSAFKDAILLLDEPGLNLHPEQQAGLIEVIRDLAETNQVLYTTHSPFMIHNFSTGSLLTVEFDTETKASKIKTNFWEGDWQTIRPILHAIGDRMLLRVFRGAEAFPVLLIVEGATDQRYIAALSSTEGDEGLGALPLSGAEPIPAGGHTEVHERAFFYFKRKRKVLALFDNEPDALAEAAKLQDKGFPKDQIIIIDKSDKEEADIEDLFSDEDYLNAVNAFYGRKLRNARGFSNITKSVVEKARDNSKPVRIVKALELVFLARAADGWGKFDKSGVCDSLCDRLARGDAKISKKSRDRFESLFGAISKAARNAVIFGAKSAEV